MGSMPDAGWLTIGMCFRFWRQAWTCRAVFPPEALGEDPSRLSAVSGDLGLASLQPPHMPPLGCLCSDHPLRRTQYHRTRVHSDALFLIAL